jgi:hypothetical protein
VTNPLDLAGRTVLVTGASSGIGRETACLISRLRGSHVILVGRNLERLAETLRLLEGDGHRAEPFDLSSTDEIPRWLKSVSASCGTLNGLVHCAGLHKLRPLRVLNSQMIEDCDAYQRAGRRSVLLKPSARKASVRRAAALMLPLICRRADGPGGRWLRTRRVRAPLLRSQIAGGRTGRRTHSGKLRSTRSCDNRNGTRFAGHADTRTAHGFGGEAFAGARLRPGCCLCHCFSTRRYGSLDNWHGFGGGRRLHGSLAESL